nr:hypothetical protein [Bacilli bacterium]
MICLNCKTENTEGAKYCIKCVSILEKNHDQNNMQEYNNEQQIMENAQNLVYAENNQSINLNSQNVSDKVSIKEYFFIVLAVILKPFTAFKEEINRFNNIKNSAILAVIISALATFLTLLKTMYSVVRVQSLLTKEVKWVWENLKEINYVQSIGKTFFIYLGIILA